MDKLNQCPHGNARVEYGHIDKLNQLLGQQQKWNTISFQTNPITYILMLIFQ